MAGELNLNSPMREICYAIGLASATDEPTTPVKLDRTSLAAMLNAVHDKYAVRFMTPSPRTSYDAKMTAMDSFARAFLIGRNVSVTQVKKRIASYLCPFDPECINAFETRFVRECYTAIASGGLMKTVDWSAGGSGVPLTNRFGLRANAA